LASLFKPFGFLFHKLKVSSKILVLSFVQYRPP